MRSSGNINTSMFSKTWLQDDEVTQVALDKALEQGLIKAFTPEQVKEQIEELDEIKKAGDDELFEKSKEDLLQLKKKVVYSVKGQPSTIYVKLQEPKQPELPLEVKTEIEKAIVTEPETLEQIEQFLKSLKKGGEGSKGGKIIGHTKSGKPIYDTFEHPEHKDFTAQDHKDAIQVHKDKIEKHQKTIDNMTDFYGRPKREREGCYIQHKEKIHQSKSQIQKHEKMAKEKE